MPESDVLQGITTWPGDIDQDIRLESAHLFQDTIGRESPRVEIVLYMYRNIGIVERNIRSSGRHIHTRLDVLLRLAQRLQGPHDVLVILYIIQDQKRTCLIQGKGTMRTSPGIRH